MCINNHRSNIAWVDPPSSCFADVIWDSLGALQAWGCRTPHFYITYNDHMQVIRRLTLGLWYTFCGKSSSAKLHARCTIMPMQQIPDLFQNAPRTSMACSEQKENPLRNAHKTPKPCCPHLCSGKRPTAIAVWSFSLLLEVLGENCEGVVKLPWCISGWSDKLFNACHTMVSDRGLEAQTLAIEIN